MKKTLFSILFTCFIDACFAQLNVSYLSASQFCQHLAGPGITIINAVNSGTDPSQLASFSGNSSPSITYAQGVLIATGDAMVAADTSYNYAAGTALGGGGDADLSGACNQQTKDLGAVEFDFISATDTVEFTFMFASEEYNYWVGLKNDVCGARLYNAGGGYANIIYLPSSFTAVCVNNVNNGSVPNVGDPSGGPCTNCQYFHDNTYGTSFKYNGYTDWFTIKMAVTPCDTFHFWLGIADAQDFIYDSAILLPENSFKAAGAPEIAATGYPAGTDTVSLCNGDTAILTATPAAGYNWSNGATTQSVAVTQPGTYYILTCGTKSNQITVENFTGLVTDTSFCTGDTLSVDVSVSNGSYLWQDNTTSPQYTFSATGNYWVQVSNGSCAFTDTFHISTMQVPLASLGNDTTLCNGLTLTLSVDSSYSGYLWSTGATSSSIVINTAGTYTVTVMNGSCTSADTISISPLNCAPFVMLQSSDTGFCEKKCLDFTDLSTNNPVSWQWFFPGADSTFSTGQNPAGICYNSYGSFDVTLIACNSIMCDTLFLPGFINVYQSPAVSVVFSNDTLFASPPGLSYQWFTIGGGMIAGATSAYLAVQDTGNYYVTAVDSNGCPGSSAPFYITGVHDPVSHQEGITVSHDPLGENLVVNAFPAGSAYRLLLYNSAGQLISCREGTQLPPQQLIPLKAGKGVYLAVLLTNSRLFRQLFFLY